MAGVVHLSLRLRGVMFGRGVEAGTDRRDPPESALSDRGDRGPESSKTDKHPSRKRPHRHPNRNTPANFFFLSTTR